MSEEKNYEVEVEECTHDCSTCSANCSSKPKKPTFTPVNQYSKVDKLIGVVSGKGGVGKSLVTCLSAVELRRRGLKTAILDADITGPSIPKAFGLHGMCEAAPLGGIMPMTTKTGIDVMSVNLLMEDETNPVVWRGPVISGTVQQFWTDVVWGDVDCMVIDCPPGTGDVPLTIFQSIPVDGIVIVTSPQDLVSMIVGKAVKMAQLMNIPILGIVENMSYFECPDCGKRHHIYGESHIEEVAAKYGIEKIARIPINSKLAGAVDHGMVELFEGDWLDEISETISNLKKD